MIEGVRIKTLRVIPDERGRLMEILRRDDEIFTKFGQIYITTAYSGVIKAWHYHKIQTDNLTAVAGMAKVALYDARENSPTYKKLEEYFMGVHNPLLIQIPPMVYHGYKCISSEETVVINCPTEPYNRTNPDECRVDPFNNDIPYDWLKKDR
ncbi:MAG TPA: dTDP-4-dehydrorhamnose 3,5-epimerase family protein [Candidatus Brocadiales bacterium]|nr:dTDP-4-dehydrorhamnose 3,5-epimerase family protein [Candidatus Brocadiales bacterium]